MRVPVLSQQPSVMPGNPYADTRPVLAEPDYSSARQLAQGAKFAEGMGNLGMGLVAKQREEDDKAKKEAEAVLEADSMLELDGQLTSLQAEFQKHRGLEASEKRAEYIEKARKARQEVAARITSPEARARFLVRSAEPVIGTSRSIESHTGKEFEVARDGTVKAREAQAIGRAEAGTLDPRDFSAIEADVIKSIRDTQRTADEGNARIEDFQARMSVAAIDGLVAQGRVDEAKKLLEESKARMGSRYVEVKKRIDDANAGAEKDRLISEGSKLVNGTYDSLLMEARAAGEEYVDPAKLEGAIELDETGPDVRNEVATALQRRIQQEAARRKADTDRERDNANRADLDRKPIPGATLEYLRKYDPDFLLAREARLRAEARAWKVANQGSAADRRAEEKLQREVDEAFRYRLEERLTRDPSADPAEVERQFILDMKKAYGRDVSISIPEREHAGAASAKTQKKETTTEGKEERAAADRAAARFEAIIKTSTPKVKGKPIDGAVLKERVGKALAIYKERVAAKGKPLDSSELAAIEAEIVRWETVETPREVFGVSLGTTSKKVMGVDLLDEPSNPPPNGAAVPLGKPRTATGKNGERYRLSADGKTWEIIK